MNHSERKHSKFSASGAERWCMCPGSVSLSEGLPDKSTPWAIEGTLAHEALEHLMQSAISKGLDKVAYSDYVRVLKIFKKNGGSDDMLTHGLKAADFILHKYAECPDSEVLVESRVHLDFIHPDMFGTYDGAVIDYFGTLHVFDYKYGQGHAVSPKENLQMIFYGIGLAHKYQWNFKRVRLWIIQPRIKGYDGPVYWDISIADLKEYIKFFKSAVNRVLKNPKEYREGSHCHFCKAKGICPLKGNKKLEEAKNIFK